MGAWSVSLDASLRRTPTQTSWRTQIIGAAATRGRALLQWCKHFATMKLFSRKIVSGLFHALYARNNLCLISNINATMCYITVYGHCVQKAYWKRIDFIQKTTIRNILLPVSGPLGVAEYMHTKLRRLLFRDQTK